MRNLICSTLLFAFTATPAVAYDDYDWQRAQQTQAMERQARAMERQAEAMERMQRQQEEAYEQQRSVIPNPFFDDNAFGRMRQFDYLDQYRY